MIRAGLLWLSEQPRIFKFVRSNRLARRLAARFVAGETVATAVAAVRDLNAHGVTASLDLLGESVAGAALQGGVQGAAVGGLSKEGGRGRELHPLPRAAPGARPLPRDRHARRAHPGARPGVRARAGHPPRAVRVPDAVRRAARSPDE